MLPTTDTDSSHSPQGKGSPIPWGAIAGGILAGAPVLIGIVVAVTIIIIIVLIMCDKRRHNLDEGTYDLPADCEKPIAPSVATIPPKMKMNVAYEQIKSFDMNTNSAYTVVAR